MAESTSYAAEIVTRKLVRPRLHIVYPQVGRLKNTVAQKVINFDIQRKVYELIAKQGYAKEPRMEVTGDYEIQLHQKGLVSLTLENYAYVQGAAHGLTLQSAVTANLNDGQIYRLKDLFRPESDYRAVVSDIIKRQINEKEIPLINEFHQIGEDQDFYVTDTAVVIFFQVYEYTPYVYGNPAFPIPFGELREIISKTGPLPRLMK